MGAPFDRVVQIWFVVTKVSLHCELDGEAANLLLLKPEAVVLTACSMRPSERGTSTAIAVHEISLCQSASLECRATCNVGDVAGRQMSISGHEWENQVPIIN